MLQFSSRGRAVFAAAVSLGLFIASAVAAPVVTSIARLQPGPVTTADTLTWRVTFSESVTGVDASDFTLTAVSGAATGTISSVSGSGSEYTVAVSSLSGIGTVRLDVNASGTGIVDGSSNALLGGFTFGQPYTQVKHSEVLSWGTNYYGESGYTPAAVTVKRSIPGAMEGGDAFAFVTTDDCYSLGVAADGTLYAWGYNILGQLGDGTTTNRTAPVEVDRSGVLAGKTVIAAMAGCGASYALTSEGRVYAWGSNSEGQLGDGTTTDSLVPVAVDTSGVLAGKTVVAIAAGSRHCLALTSDGCIYGWGFNGGGEDWFRLGYNQSYRCLSPVAVYTGAVLDGKTLVAIAAGDDRNLVLTSEGLVYAWGDRYLGNGTGDGSETPIAVYTGGQLSGKTVTAITTTEDYSLVLTSDGGLYSWGASGYRLGIGDFDTTGTYDEPLPVDMTGALAGKTVVAIAAGYYSSMALDSDGVAYSWGQNTAGQLGVTGGSASTPVAVDTLQADGSALAGRTVYALSGTLSGHTLVLASLSSIPVGTVPADGCYKAGETLTFTLTWPDVVTVTGGVPQLAVTIGSTTRYATYVSGSGTATLTFVCSVQAGDYDMDGIEVAGTTLDANGASLTYDGGSAVDLTLPLVDTSAVLVNTGAPATPIVLAAAQSAVIGYAEPESTVSVYLDGVLAGTAVADSSTGLWTLTLASALTEGTICLPTALATDSAGSSSSLSSVVLIPIGSGTTWLVTVNTDDTSAPAPGSLRYAVNNVASGDRIVFGLGSGDETIAVGAQLVVSGKSLTIDGSNSAADTGGSGTPVTIQVATPGSSAWRIFYFGTDSDDALTLESLTMKGGSTNALYCEGGNVSLREVTVTGTQTSTYGGAFRFVVCDTVELDGCTLSGNSSVAGGGFATSNCVSVALTDCTLSDNAATSSGGALYVDGNVTLVNCTFSGNSAGQFGGAVYSDGDGLVLVDCTVVGNSVTYATYGWGGGVYAHGPKLLNTIVVNNTATTGADMYISSSDEAAVYACWYGSTAGTITTATTAPSVTTSYTAGDLGALADNGGTTQTMALSASAPAAAAGVLVYHNATDGYYFRASDGNYYTAAAPTTVFTPSDPSSDLISTDQRGVTRSAPADIGAFQLCRIAAVATPAAGSFQLGDTLSFALTFNSAVTVDTISGTPRLALTLGSATVYATYDSMVSTTTSLVFTYTVWDGDDDTDGIEVATAVDLNGATIDDSVGYAADLTLPTLDTTGILVDTTAPDAPVITSASAAEISGTAEAGSTVEVFGNGVSLYTATADADGNWTLAVTMADGSYSLTATATDAAGNGSNMSTAYALTVDAAPVVATIARLLPGPVTTADTVTWRVTFSEAVSGVDLSDFVLTPVDGAATGTLSSVAAGSSAAEYIVTATGLSGIGTLRLDLNSSGTGIVDSAGNAISGGFTMGQAYTHTRGSVAVSWGNNDNGQLGLGEWGNDATAPSYVLNTGALSGKTVVAVAAGKWHSLALCSDGTVAAWGYNWYGQLGNDSIATSVSPVAVVKDSSSALYGKTVVAVAAGESHSLALCSDGTVVAWGWNGLGQLGDGSTTKSRVPVAVSTSSSALTGKMVVAVAAGEAHSLALCSDGTVAAWGENTDGQLGNNSTDTNKVPVAVATGRSSVLYAKTVAAVTAGQSHSLVLCSDGTVAAWGSNAYGQLGNGSTTDSMVPVAVVKDSSSALSGKTVMTVAAAGQHSLALCSDGTVVAWGWNSYGQLGNNSTNDSTVPVAVNTASGTSALTGKTVVAVSAGHYHSLALCSDGTVAAWGSNSDGQLGNDSTATRLGPVAVSTATETSALSGKTTYLVVGGCSASHSVALASPATITAVATPAAGSYNAGATLNFTVTFSDAATVDTTSGTPRLALTIGSTMAYATYDSTASTATALIFSYTVQEGDTDTDGIAMTEVDLNGSTITDRVGYAAALTLPTLDTTGILIDTTAPSTPTIVLATSTSVSGTAEAGSTVEVFHGSTSLGTTTADASGNWTLAVTLADAIYSLSSTSTDAAGNSTASIASTWTIDTTAPTVPANLVASATSPTAIALGWTASSDAIGVAGYRIYRGGTAIGTSTTTGYSDSGLTSSTTCSYTVSAYDAAGHESAQSTAASATTQLSGQQSLSVSDTTSLLAALATAVANPSATFTITVAAGTYTPTAGLTISTDGLTLEGSGTISGASLISGELLTISGDNVVASGLSFANGTIAITAGADNGTIADCTFTAAGISGTGCDGWALTGNSISDATTALSFTDSDDLALTDNMIVDCAQALVLTDLGSPTVRNSFIADNTTTSTTAAIVLTDVTEAQIDNNTLYAAGTAANAIEYAGSGAVGSIRNNLANKPITATGTATATLATNYTAAEASWFTDVTAGDLHLAATQSAVVDAGTTIDDLTVDIDGDTRPTGDAYDIGADEYQADTVAPSTPTGLSATATLTSRITLSWTASTDSAPSGVAATGVSGYRIYRGGTAIGTSTTTSYSDTGLSAGTMYSYTVTAYDGAANESAASSSVSATTSAASSSSDSSSSDSSSGGGGGACGLLLSVALALLALGRRWLARR